MLLVTENHSAGSTHLPSPSGPVRSILRRSKMQPTPPSANLPIEGRRLKLSPVCTTCRDKHLRCDGPPKCSRCKRNGAECTFVPSRRGMRPNKTTSTRTAAGSGDDSLFPPTSGSSAVPSISSTPSPLRKTPTDATSSTRMPSSQQFLDVPVALSPQSMVPSNPLAYHLVDLFYSHFLPGQQFLVPKELVLEKYTDPALHFLRQVIEHIGSSYSPPTSGLQSSVPDPTTLARRLPNNAYTVQGLLLLAVWFDTIHQPGQHIRHLNQARDCALAIGMNHVGFSSANSDNSQQLQQSWSSTWQVILRLCEPSSFTADQQMSLSIAGHHPARRMAAPLPMTMESQTWDWTQTYAGESTYELYPLTETTQLDTQGPQSLPLSYPADSATQQASSDVTFRTLHSSTTTTTTWPEQPVITSSAGNPSLPSWSPGP